MSCFIIFFSIRSNLIKISLCVKSNSRIRLKIRMIWIFTSIAVSLFNTLDCVATPCSIKANGGFRRPILSRLEIIFCDIRFLNSSSAGTNDIVPFAIRFGLRVTNIFFILTYRTMFLKLPLQIRIHTIALFSFHAKKKIFTVVGFLCRGAVL